MLGARVGALAQPFGFAGRPFEPAVALYDQRARAYGPATGRFLQRDPGGVRDGTNLYAYVGNQPLYYGDPTGYSRQERRDNVASDVDDLPQAPPIRIRPRLRDLVHRFNRAPSDTAKFFGIPASDPRASNTAIDHILNQHGSTGDVSGPTQWIAGSRRDLGARLPDGSRYKGEELYIDVETAKRAGVEMIDERELTALAKEQQRAGHFPERIAGWLRSQRVEREFLFREHVPPSAVVPRNAGRFNIAMKWFGRVSHVTTAWELGKAGYRSWETRSIRPFAAQVVREGSSIAGSQAGAAVGAAYGLSRGGPAAAIAFGAWGSMFGGYTGYQAGDRAADAYIYDDGQ